MNDKQKLHALRGIGYWRSPDFFFAFPHPKEMVNCKRIARLSATDRDVVTTYLNTAFPLFVNGCPQEPYFRDDPQERGLGKRQLTDGVYIWPDSLSYYFSNYSINIPDDVILHILTCRLCDHNIVKSKLIGCSLCISYRQWYQWCRRWRSNRLLALISFLDAPRLSECESSFDQTSGEDGSNTTLPAT